MRGASAPRSRSSLHGIFGIAPFRTTYELRGELRDPYSGGTKLRFRPLVLLPRASNGCGPRCRSGSVIAPETPSSARSYDGGRVFTLAPAPVFFFRECRARPPRARVTA